MIGNEHGVGHVMKDLVRFTFRTHLSTRFEILFLFSNLVPLFGHLLRVVFLSIGFFNGLFRDSNLGSRALFLVGVGNFSTFFSLEVGRRVDALFFRHDSYIEGSTTHKRFVSRPFTISISRGNAFSTRYLASRVDIAHVLLGNQVGLGRVRLRSFYSSLFHRLSSITHDSDIIHNSMYFGVQAVLNGRIF